MCITGINKNAACFSHVFNLFNPLDSWKQSVSDVYNFRVLPMFDDLSMCSP